MLPSALALPLPRSLLFDFEGAAGWDGPGASDCNHSASGSSIGPCMLGDADATTGDGSREPSSCKLGCEDSAGLEEELWLATSSGTEEDDGGRSIGEAVRGRTPLDVEATPRWLCVEFSEVELDAAREMTR